MNGSRKQSRLKKGRNYLIWAVVCLVISFGMYSADIAGAIAAFVNVAMLILFVGGLGYLVAGLVTKE